LPFHCQFVESVRHGGAHHPGFVTGFIRQILPQVLSDVGQIADFLAFHRFHLAGFIQEAPFSVVHYHLGYASTLILSFPQIASSMQLFVIQFWFMRALFLPQ
jgi:hypothetical protein